MKKKIYTADYFFYKNKKGFVSLDVKDIEILERFGIIKEVHKEDWYYTNFIKSHLLSYLDIIKGSLAKAKGEA